jgi:thymidine kinase
MPKLYFRHGAMNSSKTANLLMVAWNYRSQGKKVLLVKPRIDDRYGEDMICSRAIDRVKADLIMDNFDSVVLEFSENSRVRKYSDPSIRID